jgi:hypothetical protein
LGPRICCFSRGLLKLVALFEAKTIGIILLFLETSMTFRSAILPVCYFVTALLLLPLVVITPTAANQPVAEERPMNFALVRNGNCSETCIEWISAEGWITPDAPRRLKKLLRSLKGQKLPVVFQSFGGDVNAAISIGRMIRAAGLETAVGRTRLNDCPILDPRCVEKLVLGGWSQGEVRAGGSYCFSTCPLALAGGTVRATAVGASIGLNQIANGRRKLSRAEAARRNLDEISTVPDPALKRMLSAYLHEMGVSSQDVFAMMGLATPAGLYHVQDAEALKTAIVTKVYSVSDEPGAVRGKNVAKASMQAGGEPDDAFDMKKPDNMCHIVNQAYVRTRKTDIYSETISYVEPTGLVPFLEGRRTASGVFSRKGSDLKWTGDTAPEAVEDYPRYTSCIYVDNSEGPHFRAYWHNRDSNGMASAEVWLTPDAQRLSKVIRRFASDHPKLPSKTLSATMDYDATRVVAPPAEDIQQ